MFDPLKHKYQNVKDSTNTGKLTFKKNQQLRFVIDNDQVTINVENGTNDTSTSSSIPPVAETASSTAAEVRENNEGYV